MDATSGLWHFADMPEVRVPSWQLYGEDDAFPDVLHVERIRDRAAGLGWRIAPHRHPRLHQVILLSSGEAEFTLDGAPWPVVPPVLLSLPCGTVHGFCFSAGTDGFVLSLPARDFPNLLGPGAEAGPSLSRPLAVRPGPQAARLFDELAEVHAGRGPLRRTRLRALAALTASLAAMASESTPALADPRLLRFADLLAIRVRDGWRVDEYAQALGISARHLSRLCREATGAGARTAIEAAVFREACRLLAYTKMDVGAVGYAVGFEDPSYFSRAFRRHLGVAPSAYREQFEG